MSISQNKAESLVKQEHILEAAIKRFAYFGIGKTTLAEIADDLSISKPSLSYYFNDKHGLVTAVARKILTEFLEAVASNLQSANSVEEGLLKLLEVKKMFFKKYFLLAVQADASDINMAHNEFTETHEHVKTQIIKLVSALLEKGVDQGEIKPIDTNKTSQLLLETIAAFEHCMNQKKRIPDINTFDEIFEKQQEVIKLIFNGLKK